MANRDRDSVFDWAIPGGRWVGVRFRISLLWPAVIAIICVQRRSFLEGFLLGLCLIFAALLHEAARLFLLRAAGGHSGETMVWPLGGIQRLGSGLELSPLTLLGGGLANLTGVLFCMAFLFGTEPITTLLNPFARPALPENATGLHALLRFSLFANWTLVLANLLPALPLDGGRYAERLCHQRFGPSLGSQAVVRVGVIVGILTLVAALLFESVWVAAIAAALVAFNMREAMKLQSSDVFDDSFMGYDFSQGYTSLERSTPPEVQPVPNFWQRWLARRRSERERRAREKAEQSERELDALLEKVHLQGIEALTDGERRILRRASSRYRGRSKS